VRRLLGALLVLWAAGGAYLLRRRQSLAPLRLGQALLNDLAVLRYEVCCRRTPLTALLERELNGGPGAALWRRLGESLKKGGGEASLAQCWETAVRALPEPLDRMLLPLGPLLGVGGEALDRAINETREELTGYLRRERERQALAGRLTAAVCLSAASLLILVLI
jgi:hypothetical protein